MKGFRSLSRRAFLGQAVASARPNIVLILADDLGFSDLGRHGGEIATPNLDRLAQQCTRFTEFYNCARCCPTRSALMSGLYPHQAGIGYMEPAHKYARGVHRLAPRAYQGFLRPDVPTLGQALQRAGYQTFLSGKWHLGSAPGQPLAHTGPDYYTTDRFTHRALDFLREASPAQPYFLYLAYTAPHFNLDAGPAGIAKYRGKYRGGWDALRTRRLERQSYGHVIYLFPTLLEIAGGQSPNLEGKSLVPALRGRAIAQETRYWEHGGNRAVRAGRWKLVSYYNEVECDPVTYGPGYRTGPWELYDMERDRAESRDLAPRQAARVRALSAAYERWA